MLFNRHLDEIKSYFPQYAFYEKIGQDIRYYCTSCEDWRPAKSILSDEFDVDYVSADRFKQNNEFNCPFCNNKVTAKSFNRGFKTLKHNRVFAICNNADGKLQINITKVYLSFLPSGESDFKKVNLYTYLFKKNKATRWNCNNGSKPMKTMNTIPQDSYISNIGYDKAVLIGEDTIKNTQLKYCAYDLVEEYSVREFIAYLIFYTKHNNVEYLLKAGFKHLVYQIILQGWSTRYINWKSNNLLKMLKLQSKNDLKICGQLDMAKLEFYQTLCKSGEKHPMETANSLNNSDYQSASRIKDSYHISYSRIVSYSKKQKCSLIYWLDYLDIAAEVYDAPELMPGNIYTAHDRAVALRKFKANEISNKLMARRQQELERYKYQWQDLIIRIPQSCEEIIAEGKALKHCVGGYAERHAKGNTTIVFLRQVNEPDKPYYTIELGKDGTIRQCYGYRNNNANNPKPDKIKAFEQAYTNYLQAEVLNVRSRIKHTA